MIQIHHKLNVKLSKLLTIEERKKESTSMIIDQDMFLVELGTTLVTDQISMIQQTIFHKLLMLATIHRHCRLDGEFYSEKRGQEL